MQLFYSTQNDEKLAQLPEEEARHCIQVLRHQVGDFIQWVDGKGTLFKGTIIETSKKKCVLEITEKQFPFHPNPVAVHIAIAPTKNSSRFEWFLEKATEIGISEITPLYCEHSERKHIRESRLNKVLLAAMKQSLKAYLPTLHPLTRFQDFIEAQKGHPSTFIAHCQSSDLPALKSVYRKGADATVLIGPEGDFSNSEIEKALEHGFTAISLGKNRLRTETAGLVACHTVNLLAD